MHGCAASLVLNYPERLDPYINQPALLHKNVDKSRPRDMDRMLAERTRAAAASGAAAATALSRLLHDRLGEMLDAALTDPEGPLPQRLTAALNQVPAPAAAAELVDRLPEHSLALGDLAETLTGQSVIHYRRLAADDPARHRPDLAGSLNNQSNALAGLGRREDALAAGTEAVAIYRELAAAGPDAFRPALATSLRIPCDRDRR